MENNIKKVLISGSYFDLIASSNTDYVKKSKLVISDCDGVLTDGNSIYSECGKNAKIFGAYDTEMITFMKQQGWDFIFVSRDPTGMAITSARLKDMDCELKVLNGDERANLVKKKMKEYDTVLFVGDSLSDIHALSLASYGACPANSVRQVKEYVDYVSDLAGGHGALGEILLWLHLKMK